MCASDVAEFGEAEEEQGEGEGSECDVNGEIGRVCHWQQAKVLALRFGLHSYYKPIQHYPCEDLHKTKRFIMANIDRNKIELSNFHILHKSNGFQSVYLSYMIHGTTNGPARDFGSMNSISIDLELRDSRQ